MAQPRTFTPEHRARMVEMHAAGQSLQSVALELGFAPATISKHAKRAGLVWDRAQTRMAVEARKVDLAALRADLAHEALVAAGEFLAARNSPFLAFNFGGKDNTYEEHLLDRPPTGDIRNLIQSFGTAVAKSMDLSKFDADPNEGGAAVDAWLAHMIGDEG